MSVSSSSDIFSQSLRVLRKDIHLGGSMHSVFSFFQSNYQYFIYAFEFIAGLVGFIVFFVKYLTKKKYCSIFIDQNLDLIHLNDRFGDLLTRSSEFSDFLLNLPNLISDANILYPVHGDGEKRFEYVYLNIISKLKDPELKLYFSPEVVRDYVDLFLSCDKFTKIFKEVSNETSKSSEEARSKNFQFDRKKDQGD